jgi:hypothetical protein
MGRVVIVKSELAASTAAVCLGGSTVLAIGLGLQVYRREVLLIGVVL